MKGVDSRMSYGKNYKQLISACPPKMENNTRNEKEDTMDAETICRRSQEQTRPLLLRGGRGCVSYKNQITFDSFLFGYDCEKILGAINSTYYQKEKT